MLEVCTDLGAAVCCVQAASCHWLAVLWAVSGSRWTVEGRKGLPEVAGEVEGVTRGGEGLLEAGGDELGH